MPLIKSKSQKAFKHNIEAEMSSGKPKDQSLAIAYNVKRKAKKMAKGGKVREDENATEDISYKNVPDSGYGGIIFKAEGGKVKTATGQRPDRSDMDHGQKRGPEGYPKYQEQAQNEKGVHTPVSGVTGFPGGKGTSAAGDLAKDRYAGKAIMNDEAKKKHKEKLEEMRSMPKPKIQGLAHGGMVESKIIKARPVDALGQVLKDKESDIMDSMSPQDETEHIAYNDAHALKSKMMAKGGMINEEVSVQDAEEDMDQHPEGLESDNDQMKPEESEIMADHFAEGGMIEEEQAIEHAASIAAAIMAKRKMMAEGGEVNGMDSLDSDDSDQADLSRNAEEDANMEDQASFDALRKENYSESDGLDELDQPEDSNEHGHDIDSDKHDMVSRIRSKMKKRSPISR